MLERVWRERNPPTLLFEMYFGECVEAYLKITYKCCWPKSWLSLSTKLNKKKKKFRQSLKEIERWL